MMTFQVPMLTRFMTRKSRLDTRLPVIAGGGTTHMCCALNEEARH